MRILIRNEQKRNILIPIPSFLTGVAINLIFLGAKYSKNNSNEEFFKYIESIDKRKLKEAVKDLRATCKGMTIVDIQDKNGQCVRVIA
jgi:hypothetical protein